MLVSGVASFCRSRLVPWALALTLTGAAAACGQATASNKGKGVAAAKPVCSVDAAVSHQNAPNGAVMLGVPWNKPVQLIHGHRLAEVFKAKSTFFAVGAASPTWYTTGSGDTLTLRQGAGLKGKVLACAILANATDNWWDILNLSNAAPPGVYTFDLDHPTGTAQHACPGHGGCSTVPLSGKTGGVIGWWENGKGASANNYALVDGKQTGGSFSIMYAK